MIKLLTQDSIGKSYLDASGKEYLCSRLVDGCCHYPYYLLLDVTDASLYPYNSSGTRLDHKLNQVQDSSTTLTEEVTND
jgi:hypothetical protein